MEIAKPSSHYRASSVPKRRNDMLTISVQTESPARTVQIDEEETENIPESPDIRLRTPMYND
jgi:hypothetical protein